MKIKTKANYDQIRSSLLHMIGEECSLVDDVSQEISEEAKLFGVDNSNDIQIELIYNSSHDSYSVNVQVIGDEEPFFHGYFE